jgi:hypothetical protein
MPAAYLHGIEVQFVTVGATPIKQVNSAVIGLVGTASKGTLADPAKFTLNEPVYIRSKADAVAYFGQAAKDSYTIPKALDAILAQGVAGVMVVNVLPCTATTAVADEVVVLDATTGKGQLLHEGVATVVVKSNDLVTTYVLDTDYTLDAINGTVTRIPGGAIGAGATLKISYGWYPTAAITATEIVGTVDGGGNRTGMQAWLDAPSTYGVGPKILIAPGYASLATTIAGLGVIAPKLDAHYLCDVPAGSTVNQALATRSGSGIFITNDFRGVACYPYVKDLVGNLQPLSQYAAGVWAAHDVAVGYWDSPDNLDIKGIIGIERALSWSLDDPTSDVNVLNEAGIVTVAIGNASGRLLFGARNLSWPSSASPDSFIAVSRTQDVIALSIKQASLKHLSRAINDGRIKAVLADVNQFLRARIAAGSIVDGECLFLEGDNPPEEIALGHLVFRVPWAPAVPAERITYRMELDIARLKKLFNAA